jgi:hypothetical protein
MQLRPGVKIRFTVGEEYLYRLVPVFEREIRSPVLNSALKTEIIRQLMVMCMGKFKSGLGIDLDISGAFSGELATGEKPSFKGVCLINRLSQRKETASAVRLTWADFLEVSAIELFRFNNLVSGFLAEIIEPESTAMQGPDQGKQPTG